MLDIKSLTKTYEEGKNKVEAIRDISFKVKKGEFVALVGPSGCGKTTLLKCIAGLIKPSRGTIEFGGKKHFSKKDIGMVFQNFSSFPWLTVRKNIEFGLDLQKIPKEKKDEIVNHYLSVTGLKEFAHFYPKDLSIGMAQRIAIAMTLTNEPQFVLMDEPFGSLDSQTRTLMQELLLNIWEQHKTTILFITHDIEEAIFLADRVYVMGTKPGKIKEEIKINLPRPRKTEDRLSEDFMKLKKHIHYVIRGESIKAAQITPEIFGDKVIRIGLHTWAGITPFYYARDKGYFEEKGLNVELVGLEKEEDRVRAFKEGEIDLLHLTVDSIHHLRDVLGINCDIAMLLDNSIGGDALVSEKSVKNIKDLKGKRVAVEKEFFSHFFLTYLLDKNSLKPDDVEVVFLNSSDIGSHFLKGKIDAAVLWEPWLSGVLRLKNTRILASTAKEKNKIVSVLFARKDFIKKNHSELLRIGRVWDKTILELEKNLPKNSSKLAHYIGLSKNDFLLQVNKLEFISRKNRHLYEGKVKELILESKRIRTLMRKFPSA